MKKCNEIEFLMYLTPDELSDQERMLVKEHLADCAECAKIHRGFLANRDLLIGDMASGENPAPDFNNLEQIVMSQLIPKSKKTSPVLAILRWSTTIAAGLFLLLFMGEQAHTVRKITLLEQNLAKIQYAQTPGLIDRWAIHKSRQIIVNEMRLSGMVHDRPVRVSPFNLAFLKQQRSKMDSVRLSGKLLPGNNPIYRNPFKHTAFIMNTK